MNRGIGAIVSLLAVVLLGGCITTSQRLEVTPKLEAAPAATKRPLHAGIYYSHDFLMQEHRRALGSHSAIAPIGQMSARMFDDLLSRLFRNTSRLSVVTEEEMRLKDIDVAVAVSLEHFDFRIGMDSDSDRYSVAYRITLYSPSGIPAASWVVLGNGPPIGGMMRSFTSESTILPKAAPMMMPTAMSTTLPRTANSLNSFSMRFSSNQNTIE